MPAPFYRTPDERFDGLPDWSFAPHYVDHEGLRLHYVDEGVGDPILLLHGEPTWAFLYRRLIPPLTQVGRVIAPDYVGFGRSDKPTDASWYSYDAHYDSISQLVVERLELERLTVVVQDWGGPIGLRLAIDEPERVTRVVILNTGVGVGAPGEEWLRFRSFMRRVGTEIVPSRLIALTCPEPPTDEVLAGYDAPFPTSESKHGVVAFPELVPTEPDHPSAAAMLRVREALRSWVKPALVLFGDRDLIFTRSHAERMAALIPGAGRPEYISGAGHFLQEDRGEQVAERICSWLSATSS